MNIKLHKSKIKNNQNIRITGSKSESNRLLLLKALYPNISIENLSNSDDSVLMQKALQDLTSTLIDIHHAGTAMRFLTAYFSIKADKTITLTGSKRMKERPIGILVEALKTLGADIEYVENEGYPPLKIKGKKLNVNKVVLEANVSSQYISALVLIASKLDNGLELILEGEITSVPYIKMTLELLNQIGIETSFQNNVIKIKSQTSNLKPQTLTVESDWSSASYWYSFIALSELGTKVTLSSYKAESLQGDSVLAEIYKKFGVITNFESNTIILQKSKITDQKSLIHLDLSNAPDIAQTIAVTAFGLGLECNLSGLHTLKIKETDRLVALKNELSKLGAKISITDNTLHLLSYNNFKSQPTSVEKEIVTIKTYNDHRMAMAFAPLALKTNLIIEDADVVSKSYPDFWEHLNDIGVKLTKL